MVGPGRGVIDLFILAWSYLGGFLINTKITSKAESIAHVLSPGHTVYSGPECRVQTYFDTNMKDVKERMNKTKLSNFTDLNIPPELKCTSHLAQCVTYDGLTEDPIRMLAPIKQLDARSRVLPVRLVTPPRPFSLSSQLFASGSPDLSGFG